MSRIAELAEQGRLPQRRGRSTSRAGEGQTSEGEFWEALSTASNLKLPVLFLIEDNGYAISVPVEVNTPGGSISKLVRCFPNLFVTEVDGTDFLESYDALRYAAEYCRKRMGPALVHAHVVRPYSHSLSDDEANYRPKAERERDAREGSGAAALAPAAREGILAAGRSREAPRGGRRGGQRRGGPRADGGAARARVGVRLRLLAGRRSDVARPSRRRRSSRRARTPTTMVDLLNACMRDEMKRDPRIVMFGEDVADASRDDGPRRVQGQGRRLQGDRGPPAPLRRRPRLQLAARRGEHRRPRDRHGRARLEAGRRDPVLRLHLAGVHADPQRALQHALALGQHVLVPGRHPRGDRRLHRRRRRVPLAVGRGAHDAHPGAARRDAVQRPRRQRPAAHGDPLRRSRALPRAQAPLPPDAQQGRLSRARTTWCRSARRRSSRRAPTSRS